MSDQNKVVVFQVGHEDYAIAIDFVISIEKVEGITPIPHLPNYVKGIVKVRGELVPVIDFEQILYNRPIQPTEATRLIVLYTEDLSVCVMVNDAKEIIDVAPENIKQLGLVGYKKTEYLTGVANLEQRLITIINPSILVHSLEGIKEIQEYMRSHQE